MSSDIGECSRDSEIMSSDIGECARDSEIVRSDILKALLRLSLCRRNAENYRENYVFQESGAKV